MATKVSKNKPSKPTAIDCFAGCGGMSQGFKQAGFKVVGAIEIDADAVGVYKLNHPTVHMWSQDIRTLTAEAILMQLGIEVGELDLLGGCPPCQGFSTLRTYNGARRVRDSQNDLIFEFQRLVLGLLPKRVMMENVPGLFDNARFKKFRAALNAAGYEVKADVLNVEEYGVPQRRRRLVLLASRVSSVAFAKPSKKGRTVRDAIGMMPSAGTSGDSLHDLPEKRSRRVAARIRQVPADGGSRASLPRHLRLECHKNSDGFKDVYGRMAWDEPAPTITTGCFNPSKGRFLHPKEDRGITMREAALLQSFPKSYKFPATLGKAKIATMIGNALPPRFIKRHAQQLLSGQRIQCMTPRNR
ncbi:MAG: DNA cytosine methyltransferase [Planctomycetales bacterium]|nr:DNA cytosine methyltransferase [Planctomycetales bacterium]